MRHRYPRTVGHGALDRPPRGCVEGAALTAGAVPRRARSPTSSADSPRPLLRDQPGSRLRGREGALREPAQRLLAAAARGGLHAAAAGAGRAVGALDDGVGVTNAAHRTTPGSSDLRGADFAGSAERLERLARDFEPVWLAFVGKEAYRGAFKERAQLGVQDRTLGRHTRSSSCRRPHPRTLRSRGRNGSTGSRSWRARVCPSSVPPRARPARPSRSRLPPPLRRPGGPGARSLRAVRSKAGVARARASPRARRRAAAQTSTSGPGCGRAATCGSGPRTVRSTTRASSSRSSGSPTSEPSSRPRTTLSSRAGRARGASLVDDRRDRAKRRRVRAARAGGTPARADRSRFADRAGRRGR